MSAHQARKRFGQNFLHDQGVISRLVAFVDPKPGERIVEIGPGLGALTEGLVERCGELHVVEIDRDLIPRLQERFGSRIVIHQHDALKFDFSELTDTDGSLRVVGNLPYNISTPLLFHLLAQTSAIRDMHFMLQKEVVDRICASPGSRDYGRLTVNLGARAVSRRMMRIGAGAFTPAPKVESAFVRIVPSAPDFEIRDLGRFEQLVAAAFSQRRKTISNSLKPLLSNEQIREVGIDPALRAESLAIRDFAALANHPADTSDA